MGLIGASRTEGSAWLARDDHGPREAPGTARHRKRAVELLEGQDLQIDQTGIAVSGALALIGVDFPRGGAVGLLLEGQEARLVDDRESALLRLDRRGLATDWIASAVRLRGTMLVVTGGVDVAALEDPAALGARLPGLTIVTHLAPQIATTTAPTT